jgi:hypothetical protein
VDWFRFCVIYGATKKCGAAHARLLLVGKSDGSRSSGAMPSAAELAVQGLECQLVNSTSNSAGLVSVQFCVWLNFMLGLATVSVSLGGVPLQVTIFMCSLSLDNFFTLCALHELNIKPIDSGFLQHQA